MIYKIKKLIKENYNKKITIICKGSRNKKDKYTGIISEIYDNLFIIEMKNNTKKSFTYIDILIGTIKVKFDKI